MLRQQQKKSACCCAPQTSIRASLSVRSTWLHIWRTFRLFVVVLCLFVHLASFLSWWDLMDFHKNHARSNIFAPVLTNKIPGRKFDCFRQISSWDPRKRRRSAPQSPRNYPCPFSSVVHYKPLHIWKNICPRMAVVYSYRTTAVLYCNNSTVPRGTLNYCCSVVYQVLYYYYCTTPLLFCILLCTTVLNCTMYCTTSVLSCTNCTTAVCATIYFSVLY